MRTTRIAAIATGACIVAGGLTFGATAANAASPTATVSYAQVAAAMHAAALKAGASVNGSAAQAIAAAAALKATPATRASATGSSASAIPAIRTSTAGLTTDQRERALVATIAASGHAACQFTSEPGALVIYGTPHAEWSALYVRGGVPITLKHGVLTLHGSSLRAVGSGWDVSNTRVWVGTARCSHT